jgi:hypothetical protein
MVSPISATPPFWQWEQHCGSWSRAQGRRNNVEDVHKVEADIGVPVELMLLRRQASAPGTAISPPDSASTGRGPEMRRRLGLGLLGMLATTAVRPRSGTSSRRNREALGVALEAGLGFPRAVAQAPWRRSARGVAAEAGFVDEAPHVGSVLEPLVSGPGRDLVWVAEALGEPCAGLTAGCAPRRFSAWRMGPSPKTRTGDFGAHSGPPCRCLLCWQNRTHAATLVRCPPCPLGPYPLRLPPTPTSSNPTSSSRLRSSLPAAGPRHTSSSAPLASASRRSRSPPLSSASLSGLLLCRRRRRATRSFPPLYRCNKESMSALTHTGIPNPEAATCDCEQQRGLQSAVRFAAALNPKQKALDALADPPPTSVTESH